MLFTEVTEMLPEMELFQYIYKTADMGCQGIDTVEEHAEKRLREELRRERQEYQTIRDEADGYIRQRGDTPAGVGTMARVSAEWMSKGQLAMDDSRGKIAEMMIQGTTMGIVKTIRHLNGSSKILSQTALRRLSFHRSCSLCVFTGTALCRSFRRFRLRLRNRVISKNILNAQSIQNFPDFIDLS